MPEHTLKQFDTELEAIRSQVLQMGGLVEQQIMRAIEALTNGHVRLAREVMDNDHRVNALEVAIDEECSTVIARRQPAAKDLRMIMTVVKTITDLERIGDEAAKIARMTLSLYSSDRPVVPRAAEIQHVADIALNMLRNALDAFARLDLAVAAKLIDKTGTWLRFGEVHLGQGREKARQFLKDNPEVAAEIRQRVLDSKDDLIGGEGGESTSTDDDDGDGGSDE